MCHERAKRSQYGCTEPTLQPTAVYIQCCTEGTLKVHWTRTPLRWGQILLVVSCLSQNGLFEGGMHKIKNSCSLEVPKVVLQCLVPWYEYFLGYSALWCFWVLSYSCIVLHGSVQLYCQILYSQNILLPTSWFSTLWKAHLFDPPHIVNQIVI